MKDQIIPKSPTETSTADKSPAVGYVHTNNIPLLLDSLNISLLVSTYQAQRIMALSPNGAKLNMLMRVLARPTGIAFNEREFAICTRNQIWFFSRTDALFDGQGNIQPYDSWYVPRRAHVTGDILAHEAAWVNNQLLIVNTRFSCISKLSNDWSFVPVWKPKFISNLAAEDRCHINGLACDISGPKFVTALGENNTPGSWRDNKATGGCLIEYSTGEIVLRNLCMPHSPRFYANKLWILESGKGQLRVFDPLNLTPEITFQFPGYLRGLAFYKNYAFIGLCKIREKSTFGGLPIEQQTNQLQCAIHILNLTTGETEGFINFTKGIEEIFDIHIMPNTKKPQIVGFEEETLNGVFLFPSQL